MGLEQLPAELQLEVCNYLDNVSLKAARAVSRKLRDNASPALFRTVVACARYDALGAFQKIALDSVLQKYIKEIVFDGSLYDGGLAGHEQLYERKLGDFVDVRAMKFWSKRISWKRYKELYIEQEDLKTSGVLFQTIARALECTTNASTIVYSPRPRLIPAEAKVVKDLLPRGVDVNPSYHPQTQNSRKDHPFRLLVGALSLSQYTRIRELRVEALKDGEPGTPFTFADFDFPDADSFQAAKHLFQNLERCELNMKCWSYSDDVGGSQRIANLSKMLITARELQHLALHIHGSLQANDALMASGTIPTVSRLGLEKNTWSRLRSLTLGGLFVEGEQLLELIRRHKHTLTSVSFRQCSLQSGTWADIIDEVVYSTRILPCVLDLVRETMVPTDSGTIPHTANMEEWWYEGHVVVSKAGERNFVSRIYITFLNNPNQRRWMSTLERCRYIIYETYDLVHRSPILDTPRKSI